MANRIRFGDTVNGYLDTTFTATEIPIAAYYGCTQITEVEVDVTEIPEMFCNNSEKAIKLIKLPNIEYINGNALMYCENLETLVAGSAVHPLIYAEAGAQVLDLFSVCKHLTSMTFYISESDDGYQEMHDGIIALREEQVGSCELTVYIDGVAYGYTPATLTPIN